MEKEYYYILTKEYQEIEYNEVENFTDIYGITKNFEKAKEWFLEDQNNIVYKTTLENIGEENLNSQTFIKECGFGNIYTIHYQKNNGYLRYRVWANTENEAIHWACKILKTDIKNIKIVNYQEIIYKNQIKPIGTLNKL